MDLALWRVYFSVGGTTLCIPVRARTRVEARSEAKKALSPLTEWPVVPTSIFLVDEEDEEGRIS